MPAYYLLRAQSSSDVMWVLVRTTMAAPQVAADLRRIVRDLYPDQPVQRFARLDEILAESVADRRAYAVIAGAFAGVMLFLSVLGLGGHLTHVVAERARDLAIRSALGASSRQQLQLLVAHVVPALVGGVSVAMLVVSLSFPLLAPYLFEVGRFDAASIVASALLVTACTAASVSMPGRRASRLDPSTVLRAS